MKYREDMSPQPRSHIKTLMRIGYDLNSAIADIIDNSLTAKATQISITCPSEIDHPYLSIVLSRLTHFDTLSNTFVDYYIIFVCYFLVYVCYISRAIFLPYTVCLSPKIAKPKSVNFDIKNKHRIMFRYYFVSINTS